MYMYVVYHYALVFINEKKYDTTSYFYRILGDQIFTKILKSTLSTVYCTVCNRHDQY